MPTRRYMISIYLATAISVAGTLAVLEWGVRIHERASAEVIVKSVPEMMSQLKSARISGREIGNQMLVHNVALFSGHPDPASVKELYVGTSRTKVLRPARMGHPQAVNASGNTYNEISWGLLLQAEAARQQFPQVRRVYFEASMLLRRPNRLVLELDHRKYLPLLESLLPLSKRLPGSEALVVQVERARVSPMSSLWRLHLLDHRADIRLSTLLASGTADGSISVREDALFKQLDTRGQRHSAPVGNLLRKNQVIEITNEHIKVQRLREVASWAPWDGLFDMVALWGREHGIEVVLFQPPVRSDLQRYQLSMGLLAHVADLERVARQYGIPFIDLNRQGLGYMEDWSIFSDEDHMETCSGVVLLQSALDIGVEAFNRTGNLMPVVPRDQVERKAATQLTSCEVGAVR